MQALDGCVQLAETALTEQCSRDCSNRVRTARSWDRLHPHPQWVSHSELRESRGSQMSSVILILQQDTQLLQLILTLNLHLHDHIDALFLINQESRNKPEIIPVAIEAHRRPLVLRNSAAERFPVLMPISQCHSDGRQSRVFWDG